MELKGKVKRILPLQTGEGKNGTWKKQEFIIARDGQFPKDVCVEIWGDKIDQFALNEGEDVVLSIDIQSREYNGKWFTSVQAWKAQKASEVTASSVSAPPPPMADDFPPISEDDLPF
jgi:hypothetical protein